MGYLLFTDTGCDIAPALLDQWHVRCVDLTFHKEDCDRVYTGTDIAPAHFYQQMREGAVFKTSAANMEDFRTAFTPVLEAGQDILYLGFSSGLSSTVHTAKIAAEELTAQHPQRTVQVIDTLCASGGQGFLVYLAMQKQASGASLAETAAYIESLIPHMCHWFTVDDLVYLKRGGRVSPTTALVGNLLGIKPILHVDADGHLIKKSTVRGRRQSILSLAEKYRELSDGAEDGAYCISHGDCPEDAKLLEQIIREHTGRDAALIVDIGPVIGSHSGPGTLALFFHGKNR